MRVRGIWVALAAWTVIAVQAGVATAQAPSISVTQSFTGAGVVGFEVTVELDDALDSSVFVDVVFSGPFVQLQAGVQDVDTESDALSLDGTMGYDLDLDSYFRTDGYPEAIEILGGEVGNAEYSAMLGSGSESMRSGSVPLAYLVLPEGQTVTFDAVVSRGGVNYVLVPEPGIARLGAAALLTLVGIRDFRRLRRSKT